jgi:cytochrome c oxidase cbb3-type subunit 2/cytochrome c oxidase cbb3-type subunit I/II
VNCHSQLVRSTLDDVRRFGPPSEAWEGEQDYPQLWGTRRIGPDLARESGRRPHDWHLAHLWNPRNVVPGSMMPAYPWLFGGSPLEPTQEARDLAAYLDSLGRDARVAGMIGPRPLPDRDPDEEKRMGALCDCAIPRTAGPAPLLRPPSDRSERVRLRRRGAEVFARECSGCHGPHGRGDGPGAEALLPRPRDLTSVALSDRAVSRFLWHGVTGSSMPAWNELPFGELRALAVYVQALGADSDAAEVPLDPAEVDQGRTLYTKNCAACHGASGGGNGTTAAILTPPPTNFRQERPTQADAEAVLAKGVAGTSMSPWESKLTEGERRLLARYVRSFFQPEPPENQE